MQLRYRADNCSVIPNELKIVCVACTLALGTIELIVILFFFTVCLRTQIRASKPQRSLVNMLGLVHLLKILVSENVIGFKCNCETGMVS